MLLFCVKDEIQEGLGFGEVGWRSVPGPAATLLMEFVPSVIFNHPPSVFEEYIHLLKWKIFDVIRCPANPREGLWLESLECLTGVFVCWPLFPYT